MSFVNKVISSQGDYFYKVNATDATGRRAYYYIIVDKLKLRQFLALKSDGRYDLAEYGNIIASGYGEEPPEITKKLLKEKYGFDIVV
jgi:hypothetical protein